MKSRAFAPLHYLWFIAVPVMTPSCVDPLPLYRPRDPRASDLWRLMDQHFETFQQVYDERFQAKYGFWRPLVNGCTKWTPWLVLVVAAR